LGSFVDIFLPILGEEFCMHRNGSKQRGSRKAAKRQKKAVRKRWLAGIASLAFLVLTTAIVSIVQRVSRLVSDPVFVSENNLEAVASPAFNSLQQVDGRVVNTDSQGFASVFHYQIKIKNKGKQTALNVKLSIEPPSEDEILQLEKVGTLPVGWEHLVNVRDSTRPEHPYVHIIELDQLDPQQTLILDYIGYSKSYRAASYLAVKVAAREYKEMVRPNLGLNFSPYGPHNSLQNYNNEVFENSVADPRWNCTSFVSDIALTRYQNPGQWIRTFDIRGPASNDMMFESPSANALGVRNVNLEGASGSQHSAQSYAASMTIGGHNSVPTINSFSWASTPMINQNFSGRINGTNFVVGGSQVFFCIAGSNTCYQQPAAPANSSDVSEIDANLSKGANGCSWMTAPGTNLKFKGAIAETKFGVVGVQRGLYSLNFVSSAPSKSVSYSDFKPPDEVWKFTYEGPDGAHWGVRDQIGPVEAGLQNLFQKQLTTAKEWNAKALQDGAVAVETEPCISSPDKSLRIKVLESGGAPLSVQTTCGREFPAFPVLLAKRPVQVRILDSGGSELSISTSVSAVQTANPIPDLQHEHIAELRDTSLYPSIRQNDSAIPRTGVWLKSFLVENQLKPKRSLKGYSERRVWQL
jgi:hypothetical protein